MIKIPYDRSVPSNLYHGLTIDQFIDHWDHDNIRGLSRHHIDTIGQRLGTWFYDDLSCVVENGHGIERSNEHIQETRIIVELSGVPNPQELDPNDLFSYLPPHKHFYAGDIPISYIIAVFVDQPDEDQRETDIKSLLSTSVPSDMIRIHKS